MSSLWKSIKNVTLPALLLGTGIQIAVPTLVVSPVNAQTPGESSIKQVDRRYNISFDYRGCQRTQRNARVTCEVIATNFNNNHIRVSFGARNVQYQTRLVDNSGNVYTSGSLQLNQYDSQDKILTDLAPGIPTKLVFNFRVPEQVTQLSALDLGYLTVGRVDTINRITLSNLGAIASTAKK
ncbi:hypothetical protein [Calothrix sp. UHCC 0171]|uniref:hypothetical protein n=1 Tax=Calothrix sp. UHCC 0171 TaxID=3110245 RepID=UPI002B210BED|nr:hypothetical protein [Calothrix sp. UHCC 0171]MEA5571687.1 hypothetical protein [Calothrix sp. UHCC 0171]